MNHDIRAVIWDMGGVLLQEVDPAPRAKLAEEYKINLSDLREQVFVSSSARLAGLGQITEEEHWLHVARTFGIPQEELARFQLRFWAGDRVDPLLSDFISGLRGRYQIALLSNAWSNTRRALDEYYNCLGLFDQIIISAEVKMAKPDPAIYHEMLHRLDVAPKQSIFVDDLQENIDTANLLGIHGVLFVNSTQVIEDVKKLLE